MEYARKYWYVIAGAVLILVMISRSRSAPGATVTQIGGGQEALQLASLESQDRLAADAQKYSFLGSLLGYSLETDRTARSDALTRLQIDANERIAIRQAEASEIAAQYGFNSNQAGINAGNYQAMLQYQLQQQALQAQGRSNNWQNVLGAIFGGFDRVAPFIFNRSGGGWGDIFDGGWGGGSGAPSYRSQFPYPPGVVDAGMSDPWLPGGWTDDWEDWFRGGGMDF